MMIVGPFLLEAPETCFSTCYDLILHAKDVSTYYLDDCREILLLVASPKQMVPGSSTVCLYPTPLIFFSPICAMQ